MPSVSMGPEVLGELLGPVETPAQWLGSEQEVLSNSWPLHGPTMKESEGVPSDNRQGRI